MMDRERLRQLARDGDVPATRQLAREQLRSPTPEDSALLDTCLWFQLRAGCAEKFDAWRQFADLLLRYPDADDYKFLNEAGRDHILGRDHADIMDFALAKIRPLLSIPAPFSIRNDPKFNRRRR